MLKSEFEKVYFIYIILSWNHKDKQTFVVVCSFIVTVNKLRATGSRISLMNEVDSI